MPAWRAVSLLEMQRQAGETGGVVLEGRDIGTVVFPEAEVKFFLTARPEGPRPPAIRRTRGEGRERDVGRDSRRRVLRRDKQDSTSARGSLLRQAEDATAIDDSDISVDETVSRMVACWFGRKAIGENEKCGTNLSVRPLRAAVRMR